MNIKGKKVTLRAIEERDLEDLQKWSNDPDIQKMLGGFHMPSSMDITKRWFESLKNNELNQRFAIDSEEYGLIGTANLVSINWKDRNAFHGMLLGNEATRGQGFGTDTVMAIMRFAFEEMGLERLDSTIIANNAPSLKMYLTRCGWKEEGRKKNWYWRGNRHIDKVIIGINREDYFKLIKENKYWDA